MKFLLASILFFGGTLLPCQAQFTLTGQSGNFMVPEARVIGDKQIAFGTSFHPEREAFILHKNRQGTHEIHNFVTLGFLPFMELTLNLTRIIDGSTDYGIGDRSASLRFLIVKETDKFPAIGLGAYLPLGVNNYLDSYFVNSTKTLNLFNRELTLTLGLGSPWIARTRIYSDSNEKGLKIIEFYKKTNGYQVGLLAAARWKLTKNFEAGIEFDGNNVNVGLLTNFLFEKCFIKIYTLDFKTIGFGLSYKGAVK